MPAWEPGRVLTSLRPGRGFFLNTEAPLLVVPLSCLSVCFQHCGACPHFRGGEEGDFKKNPNCPTVAEARGP